MNWLASKIDKVIETFAPKLALERTAARHSNEMLKLFYKDFKNTFRNIDAIDGGRTQYDFLNITSDADSVLNDKSQDLRNRVRDAERNSGTLKGPLKRSADHVVGTGFNFQSRVVADGKYVRVSDNARISKDEAANHNFWAEKYFNVWKTEADIRLLQEFDSLVHLAYLTYQRDGEVLVIGRNSNKRKRLVPYCLQVLEIDHLETPADHINNPNVRNGIRYDSEGAPASYFVLKRHPGNTISFPIRSSDEYEEIPAYDENGCKKVLHLFRILRPEQSRGFAEISAGLPALQQADRYKNAEMFAALQDACMVATIKSNNPQGFQNNYTKTGTESGRRINEISPGMVHYLNNGEEINIRDPKRPNDKFDTILQAFLRDPANSMNMPPELFLQNWQGMNYSNARTVLIMWLKVVRLEQQYLINSLLSHAYRNFTYSTIQKGLMMPKSFFQREWDYLKCQWIPPKIDWIDPETEVEGKVKEIAIYSETPTSICASKGTDFSENARTLAQNIKEIKDLEKEYDIEMPSLIDPKQMASLAVKSDESKPLNGNQSKNKNGARILPLLKVE